MVLLIAIILFYGIKVTTQLGNEGIEEQVGYGRVIINEAKHLLEDIPVTEVNKETVQRLRDIMYEDMGEALSRSVNIPDFRRHTLHYIVTIGGILLLFLALVFWYMDKHILRPFRELEAFAESMAKGCYDIALSMKRKNVFGAFTQAFDIMRNELMKARESEEAAKESKKTLMATLSHDIKTPVASIRAYAERLHGGGQIPDERRRKYLGVIMKKADELTKLTDDLFLHTVSDMDKLAFNLEDYGSLEVLEEILLPLYIQYDTKLQVQDAIPHIRISTDKLRLARVFGNIMANAYKYAPDSLMELSFQVKEDYLECTLRDHGEGVRPEDIPFLFAKFYRGQNGKAQGNDGAGLGLYIVKYIMDKTHGYVNCKNADGFHITIGIKRI